MLKSMLLSLTATVVLVSGCGAAVSPTTNQTQRSLGNQTMTTQPSKSPLMGHPANPFSLQTLNGTKVTLQQLLAKHQVILVNAWASWCYPCQQETPDLVALSKKYEGKVQFVGVNITHDDSVSGARNFVEKYHIPYTILLDTTGSFTKSYQVMGYPTTFILSPSGMIENVHIGILTKAQMQQMIQDALKTS